MESREELRNQTEAMKRIRERTGMNRREFSDYTGIPLRTLEDWESGRRRMADYMLRLLAYRVQFEGVNSRKEKNVHIIQDEDGKSIVIINDIRFKGKKKIDWNEVEEYLKEYIGRCYEIAETSEKIYIGTDFPDEFAHSKDTKILRGPNEKAKANSMQAIGELIQIATAKTVSPDFNERHKNKAKYGWYRYDTRVGLPVYDNEGNLERYNIFSIRMLVRHGSDDKLYLYDMLRTKKETSKPLEQ